MSAWDVYIVIIGAIIMAFFLALVMGRPSE